MILIVGLGNPGDEYRYTRHNAGFLTVQRLAERNDIALNKIGCKAVYGKGKICGEDVILALPQTYMNESGISVKQLMSYFRVPTENLIVIYDDMDTDTGSLRIRLNGSAGTHNGMKSIIYHLETDSFKRIRIGIGRPEHKNIIDYVLGRFSQSELQQLSDCIDTALDAVDVMLTHGTETAMNRFNRKNKKEIT